MNSYWWELRSKEVEQDIAIYFLVVCRCLFVSWIFHTIFSHRKSRFDYKFYIDLRWVILACMSERDPVISSSSFTFCSAHEEWAFLIPNSILRHFYFTILRDSFLIKEKNGNKERCNWHWFSKKSVIRFTKVNILKMHRLIVWTYRVLRGTYASERANLFKIIYLKCLPQAIFWHKIILPCVVMTLLRCLLYLASKIMNTLIFSEFKTCLI